MSPDSKWLAYVSNESGREEVYVRSFSGGGGRSSTVPGTRLIAATVATSPSLGVSSRVVLFEGPFETDIFHQNYDVGLDDESFVMVRPVEANRQLVLVVNWIQELRQRTGSGE